jgi:hypothetical protein
MRVKPFEVASCVPFDKLRAHCEAGHTLRRAHLRPTSRSSARPKQHCRCAIVAGEVPGPAVTGECHGVCSRPIRRNFETGCRQRAEQVRPQLRRRRRRNHGRDIVRLIHLRRDHRSIRQGELLYRSIEVSERGERNAIRRNRRRWRRGGGRRSGIAIIWVTGTASHQQAAKEGYGCRERVTGGARFPMLAPVDPHGLQGSVLGLAVASTRDG